MAKILIIEDDRDTAFVMREWLSFSDHEVDLSHDASQAVSLLHDKTYQLVILDLGLPDVDGSELLQTLRGRGTDTPILVVSGRDSIDSKVLCLDTGADDYITKPFHFKELVSRTQVLLRRNKGLSSNILRAGPISINLSTKKVECQGEEVKLAPQEYSLLEFFLTYPDTIYSTKQLIEKVWNGSAVSNDAVRSCIKRLRQKFGEAISLETLSAGWRLNITHENDSQTSL